MPIWRDPLDALIADLDQWRPPRPHSRSRSRLSKILYVFGESISSRDPAKRLQLAAHPALRS